MHMKGFFVFFLCFFLSKETKVAAIESNDVYIVYTGAVAGLNGSLRNDHVELLSSVLRRNENSLVHTYNRSFTGFAARLSKVEARSIAKKTGVVSVFAEPILKLRTTRSWDFLNYETVLETNSSLGARYGSWPHGSDTIIGILDTGIWPESKSFNDKGMGPIPSRWKGTCMEGEDFSSANCNRKLIGARYYNQENLSARDTIGHGTHVASIAAGSYVPGVSYYGLAAGTAKGGSPGSRIAIYKVCTSDGCHGSDILAAFDDAIADGVDVLSLSLGAGSMMAPDFLVDPIAIGAFHAVEKGATVVCAGGNDGPYSETVANVAPWILTVGATTIDRDFQSNIVLGNNKVIKGEALNFANIRRSPVYPLIYGGSAKLSSAGDFEASNCNPDSIDGDKIKGKIVLCRNNGGEYGPDEKIDGIRSYGGVGIILIDDVVGQVAYPFGADPITAITSKVAAKILSYINSTRNPVATILPTKTVMKYKPAPAVAAFSSRGPTQGLRTILKPDIVAPGVAILAAWKGNDTLAAPAGKEAPLYNIASGTSMASPHVTGIVATVKSWNPTWSPSAIRSAIMTTATQINNLRAPITTESGSMATPYDFGAGQASTIRPLRPGLVYETYTVDYLTFLCQYGYDMSTIKLILLDIPHGFKCPKDIDAAYISNMNYPSIAISGFDGKESKKVRRTVTNVGEDAVYTARVKAPKEVKVQVIPNELHFTRSKKKLSYQVIFASTTSSSLEEDVFGSITWTNGKNEVYTPFVVSSAPPDNGW